MFHLVKNLGMESAIFVAAVVFKKDARLTGISATYVDDSLHAGTKCTAFRTN